MEAASCAALQLPEGRTSVGSALTLEHIAPSAVGDVVDVDAVMIESEGRRFRFRCEASCAGISIGTAEITRVDVNAERFLQRLASR